MLGVGVAMTASHHLPFALVWGGAAAEDWTGRQKTQLAREKRVEEIL